MIHIIVSGQSIAKVSLSLKGDVQDRGRMVAELKGAHQYAKQHIENRIRMSHSPVAENMRTNPEPLQWTNIDDDEDVALDDNDDLAEIL
jgi:hypothetical protein